MHFLIFLVQKSFLTKYYFLTAEINLTTRGALYTCLVGPEKDQCVLSIYWKRYYYTWLILIFPGSFFISDFVEKSMVRHTSSTKRGLHFCVLYYGKEKISEKIHTTMVWFIWLWTYHFGKISCYTFMNIIAVFTLKTW